MQTGFESGFAIRQDHWHTRALGGQWFTTADGNGNPIFTAPAAGTFVAQGGVRDNIYGPIEQNRISQ